MEMPLGPQSWMPVGTEGWEETLDDDDQNLRLFTVARQIAPFRYNNNNDSAARVREAHRRIAEANGNMLVVTTDVGNPDDIHPIQKKPVGQRLAGLALAGTYGHDLCATPPRPTTALASGSTITISFQDTCANLATNDNQQLRGFTVVLPNGTSRDAPATIQGPTILVTASDAVAVRYGWSEVPDVNLTNSQGLPASPFEIKIDPER